MNHPAAQGDAGFLVSDWQERPRAVLTIIVTLNLFQGPFLPIDQ